MAQKTHYDDNLFYLNAQIKTIKNGISLEIDREFFLEKTVDDLFFLDSVLVKLYALIKENVYLIKRPEHLRSIQRSKKMYVELIETIQEKKSSFADGLEPYFPKLALSREEHLRDIEAIQDMLTARSYASAKDSFDVISEEELKFLFTSDKEAEVE
jgi:hypothetical protein